MIIRCWKKGEALRQAADRRRRELRWATFRDAMKAGDPMQVIAGPFESFLATIVSLASVFR